MRNPLDNHVSKFSAASSWWQTKPAKEMSTPRPQQSQRVAGILLALLPIISFLGQYLLSRRTGTEQVMLHHPTITVVDWIFVPFNFFVVRVIEWRRGGRLYVIMGISLVLGVLTHAFWQYNGLDPGHMITRTGIVLPAGWVHLAFSVLEMVLLVAFVFCRKDDPPRLGLLSVLATAYFLTMGICGYVIHGGFLISDVVALFCGLFFILVYPRLVKLFIDLK